MTKENRIISDEELQPYLKTGSPPLLADRVRALFDHQKATWPLLSEGYSGLMKAETKTFEVEESRVVVQYNPARIRSTAARVDKASVEARRCFLCLDALPPEEKGIEYARDFMIFCNPFPVLDGHLSVVHKDHTEQKIAGNVELMLALARDLSSDYFVLYNGPRCGASAPDHLHLQACSRALLPIEAAAFSDDFATIDGCAQCAQAPPDGFELFTLGESGRSVVVFRGTEGGELADWVYKTLVALPVEDGATEPMVNIICTHDKGVWTVYLFPRAKHRPACFFAEGEHRLTISPGAIDMAGVLVVPEREHYEKIERQQVESIYREVSLDAAFVDNIIENLFASSPVEEF